MNIFSSAASGAADSGAADSAAALDGFLNPPGGVRWNWTDRDPQEQKPEFLQLFTSEMRKKLKSYARENFKKEDSYRLLEVDEDTKKKISQMPEIEFLIQNRV